ncbi:hypothetical protein HNY73_012830 [Argiope bruennichi]|uniref:Uncharacterized protein n=1 Tax=Argiope bruennichi TaxID=94029 RepID=A0A8T0EW70_ARGBR|nr:hypothetical protein HNY73_012830 [Argiope bruennichi]
MINEQLKCGLKIEICDQVRTAKNYCPRIVVLNRVLKTVCDHLNIFLSDLPDVKNTIYIDAELRQMMEDIWNLQSHPNTFTGNNATPAVTNGDNEELEKMLAKDYVKPSDMLRFTGILSKRETKQTIPTMSKIYKLLGVDGYLGNDLKRCVEYLKYSNDDYKTVHVHAIRQMYRDGLCQSPEDVYFVLQTTFGFTPFREPKDEELKLHYTNLVGDKLDQISE